MSIGALRAGFFERASYYPIEHRSVERLFFSKNISISFQSIGLHRNFSSLPRIIDLSKLWGDSFNIFMTCLLGATWVGYLVALGFDGAAMYQNIRDRSFSRAAPVPFDFDRLKTSILDAVSLTGISANFGDWAHEEGAIDLGAWAPSFKFVGYGASCISCGSMAHENFLDFFSDFKKERSETSSEKKLRLRKQMFLHLLQMLSSGMISFWALIGCIALLTGLVFPGLLVNGLICGACVLAISALFYKVHFL